MEEAKKEESNYIDMEQGTIYGSADEAVKARHEKIQEELANRNPDFIQLTKGIGPATLARIGSKSPSALAVLMFFFENMDKYNTIMVSQNVIAEELEKSRQTISKAIKVLQNEKVLGVAKVGQANAYIVNQYVAWQNGYRKRNTMNLRGNILLGENENKELFNEFGKIEQDSFKMKSITTRISK